MSNELTATDIDAELSGLGISYRWRADVDEYSITFTTYNHTPPNALADCLLRLRAIIDAIDASGMPGRVPLRSFQIPLLTNEHDRLQSDARERIKSSKGGGAGKGHARSAAVAALRKAFTELGRGKKTEAYLAWLQRDSVNCEYSADDDKYEFHYDGLNTTTLNRREVMKAISRERKKS